MRLQYLVVGAVLLPAFFTLQQVSGGASSFGHLMLPDGLLGENAPQLFQLITGHLLQYGNMSSSRKDKLHDIKTNLSVSDGQAFYLSRHGGDAAQLDVPGQYVFA